jgi:uncharacterized membrane protein YbhN (UPF0104 family)
MNHRENPDTGSVRSSESSQARKRVLFGIKAVVSAAALTLVLRSVDLASTLQSLAASRKGLWAAGLAFLFLSQVISTVRWRILLRPLGFDLPWKRVLKVYFSGMFFSLFLPTVVGGDGIKTFYVASDWRRVPAALYTLLADRSLGLAAMMAYVPLGLPVVWAHWPRWLALAVLAFTASIYLLLLLLPRVSGPVLRISKKLREVPRDRLFVYWEQPGPAIKGWLISLIVHLCVILSHVMLAASLGLDLPAATWAIIYPATAVVAFLPISLSGVGPREAAYVYLLGLSGIPREEALSLGIMWLSIVIINGLVGGGIYLFGGELRASPKSNAQSPK